MKVYEGGRSLAGAVVTVDGRPLPPRLDLGRFSPAGFEWTYEGAGPRQLALALLADHLGDDRKALALHERFMSAVVADLDNAWRLTSQEIDAPAPDRRLSVPTGLFTSRAAGIGYRSHTMNISAGRPGGTARRTGRPRFREGT